MIEKARALTVEYDELQKKLSDTVILTDHREVARLSKRKAEIEPVVALLKEEDRWEKALHAAEELREQPGMEEMAEEGVQEAKERLRRIAEDLHAATAPRGTFDDRNTILEVRAGTGGEEAALFAAELLRMYLRYAERKKWETELLEKSDAEGGGIKQAAVRIAGNGVYGLLKHEGGVHRVQRIPATEAKGRIHTSTATVAVLPEAEEVDVTVRSEDLRVDTFRSGGSGGQHVNKTESAIRITHIPTGTVVSCQSERSQIQNRARAMEFLRAKLFAIAEEEKARTVGDLRAKQAKSAERSDKIRTYNFPQDRVTDHRLGKSFFNLPGILEGNIHPIVEGLHTWSQTQEVS